MIAKKPNQSSVCKTMTVAGVEYTVEYCTPVVITQTDDYGDISKEIDQDIIVWLQSSVGGYSRVADSRIIAEALGGKNTWREHLGDWLEQNAEETNTSWIVEVSQSVVYGELDVAPGWMTFERKTRPSDYEWQGKPIHWMSK